MTPGKDAKSASHKNRRKRVSNGTFVSETYDISILKEGDIYRFSVVSYAHFREFLKNIYALGYDEWPADTKLYPKYKGMPSYILRLYDQENDQPYLIIEFSSTIILPNGQAGTSFRMGGNLSPEYLPLRF